MRSRRDVVQNALRRIRSTPSNDPNLLATFILKSSRRRYHSTSYPQIGSSNAFQAGADDGSIMISIGMPGAYHASKRTVHQSLPSFSRSSAEPRGADAQFESPIEHERQRNFGGTNWRQHSQCKWRKRTTVRPFQDVRRTHDITAEPTNRFLEDPDTFGGLGYTPKSPCMKASSIRLIYSLFRPGRVT